MTGLRADAVLFDKDGTLFDFGGTWNDWAAALIAELSGGDTAQANRLADAIRFDLEAGAFFADSLVIAGTNLEAAEALSPVLPDWDLTALERHLARSAAQAPLSPAVPLDPYLADLAARGLALGVMTNDAEMSALAQLAQAGVRRHFDFVAGFDSGHGAKPAPDPLLAFCAAVSVRPDRAVMVGDSTHDLVAGRAAGMATVGVLTGMAASEELAPFADVVLPHIGFLPAWLAK